MVTFGARVIPWTNTLLSAVFLAATGCGAELEDEEELDESALAFSVGTKAGLLNALSQAKGGDVIQIQPSASIDLTGHRCGGGATSCLTIPAGVVLDGGRSASVPGALLYTNDRTDLPGRGQWFLLRAGGPGVTIRRLRLRGPDGSIGNAEVLHATGIASGHDRLMVDRCEIYNWSAAAVAVGGRFSTVQRSYIHHNQRAEWGYAVGPGDNAQVLIQYNTFDYNRHVVAGASGVLANGWYEARFNTVLAHNYGDVFDMHGSNESLRDNSTDLAGSLIYVHHNRIYPPAPQRSAYIRGTPRRRAYVENNCVVRADSAFVTQSHVTIYDSNPPAGENCAYRSSTDNYTCWHDVTGSAMTRISVSGNRLGASTTDCDASPNGVGPSWCVAEPSQSWRRLYPAAFDPAEILFGDFTGDGREDILRANGAGWRVAHSGVGMWDYYTGSSVRAANLLVGDFNGDGKDDVLRSEDSTWWLSASARSGWAAIRSSEYRTSEIKVGDFNGDGKDDAFTTTGGRWYVAYGATGSWHALNTSGAALGQLALGDFNGDGRSDVLYPNGTDWLVSWSGTSSWRRLRSSNVTLAGMRIGDFNGDGKDDILSTWSGTWWVSYGGTSGWNAINRSGFPVSQLRPIDTNGDGIDELFTTGC